MGKEVLTRRTFRGVGFVTVSILIYISLIWSESLSRRITILSSLQKAPPSWKTRELDVGQFKHDMVIEFRENGLLDGRGVRNGIPEKEQLKRAWSSFNPNGESKRCFTNKTANYTYSVTVAIYNFHTMYIVIEERKEDSAKNATSSSGGSNFRIEVTGNESMVCPVRDFFNGTYLGYCDVHSSIQGTIYLDYTDFDAFRHHNAGLKQINPCRIHRKIHSFDYVYHEKTGKQNARTEGKNCNKTNIEEYMNGRWWNIRGQWKWGTKSGCIFEYMTEADLWKCYNRKTTFRILGDSHLRYLSNYLNQLLSKYHHIPSYTDHITPNIYPKHSVPDRKELIGLSNYIFKWTPWTSDWLKVIRSLSFSFHNKPATSDDVVVMDLGIHDVELEGAYEFIKQDFGRFVDLLGRVRKNPSTAKIHLIYVNILPRILARNANDYMAAAVNEIIRESLVKYGVEIIDGFHIVNPMKATSCDGSSHFLCPIGGDPRIYEGQTGMTLAHLLFRKICDL